MGLGNQQGSGRVGTGPSVNSVLLPLSFFSRSEGYLNNDSRSATAQSPVSLGFKRRLLTVYTSPALAMTPGCLFKEITGLVLEILFSNFGFNPDPL